MASAKTVVNPATKSLPAPAESRKQSIAPAAGPAAKPAPGASTQDAFKRAADFLSAGDTAKAIQVFQQIVDEHPGDVPQRIQFARLLISAGKSEEARKILEPILAESPDNVEALYNLALIEDSLGNVGKEREYLEKILAVDPTNSEANASLGQLYLADNKLIEAAKAFSKGLKSNPDNVTALIGEGNVLLQNQKAKQAEAMFDRVIKLQPDLSVGYSDRAQARAAVGNYDGAEADLTKAINLDPGYYWHYIDRGRLRLTLGHDKKGAMADFEKAVTLKPDYFLGYVYLAGMHDEAHDYAAAARDYKKLLELRPDYYFVYRPYAILLYMQQKWNTAREYFEKASKSNPNDHGAQMFVVLTYLKEKDNLDATEYLKRMLAVLPQDGLFFPLAKMYLDPSYDSEFINRLQQERNPDVRTRMLFYLACFYELHDKKRLAERYFLDVDSHPIEGMYEYPVNKWELENYKK